MSAYTPAQIKERLEQAGYALQRIVAERPMGHKTGWPDIPRLAADNWLVELMALESWKDENNTEFLTEQARDVRARLEDEANRNRTHATRAQLAALDEMLPLIYRLEDIAQRKIVTARMCRHPVSGRHRYSWSILSRVLGLSRTRVRDLHASGIEKLTKLWLTEVPKAHRDYA